jgi:hypothetical protein
MHVFNASLYLELLQPSPLAILSKMSVTSSSTMEAFAAAGGLDLDRLVAIFSFTS